MKKSKKRGDVKDKGGNIMGTPNQERSAGQLENMFAKDEWPNGSIKWVLKV